MVARTRTFLAVSIEITAPNRAVFTCKGGGRDRAFAFVSQKFHIRQATPDDAAIIGWHRARMFQDMGLVPDELFESFRQKHSIFWAKRSLPAIISAGW